MDAKSSYTFDIIVRDINDPDDDPFGFAAILDKSDLKNKKNVTAKVKTEIINTKFRIVSCSRLG
jgi:predicted phosphoribosyltransferase